MNEETKNTVQMPRKAGDTAKEKNPPVTKFGEGLDFASQEAYNLLRANITFSFSEQEKGRIIGVTSACPSDGKTTTSINIAYSMAKSGKKVLLIDGDMRKPKIHRMLAKPLSPGLSNLLVTKPSGITHSGVMHENLSILTAGDIPPNPSELLASLKMKDILDFVSQHYDFVIIDLPPVLAVSDALSVSQYLDGIILVVRHKVTRRREINDAVRQLRFAKARILGFVYNDCGHSEKGYYKKHGHYYKDYKN